MTMGRVSERLGKTIGLGLIAIMLAGCASFATPVGPIAKPEESATIVGYFRYYIFHSSYGEIYRVDSSWPGGSTYAVKVAPGQHLVDLGMTQVSIMNPLMIGAGSCALILTAEPGKTYHIRPPSFGACYRFWYNIGTFTLLQKRFRSTISVAVSGGGDPDRNLDLPIDCLSDKRYCRVASDCVGPPGWKPGAKHADASGAPPECIYDEHFPVGTCSLLVPVQSPETADIPNGNDVPVSPQSASDH